MKKMFTIFIFNLVQKHGLGQGRKGGDEEYAADEDGPDTTDHPRDFGTDVTAQISEAHFDHQVLCGLLVSFMLLLLDQIYQRSVL